MEAGAEVPEIIIVSDAVESTFVDLDGKSRREQVEAKFSGRERKRERKSKVRKEMWFEWKLLYQVRLGSRMKCSFAVTSSAARSRSAIGSWRLWSNVMKHTRPTCARSVSTTSCRQREKNHC